MPIIEFKMPKMGESISEATIISWLKNVGDFVDAEETILEVATDKVDSEVASPVSGTISEIRFQKDDIVAVGSVLALINSDVQSTSEKKEVISNIKTETKEEVKQSNTEFKQLKSNPDAFLSPLIISIAQKENLSLEEVQSIPGSGTDGRIQKSDVFNYLKNRKYPLKSIPTTNNQQPTTSSYPKPKINYVEGKDRIVEMDRMRKMIADHMVYSKQTSPHVTSYIEVDVTNLVDWRNANKNKFQEKYKEKLTFTPIFVQAVAKAIEDFPLINVSVDDKKIYVHKDINIGMATALPSGNLIVPVVKNANEKDLVSLAKDVNQLAEASRNNKLKPEQIQGSTFTISNVGTFGSLMGTPIINQPEVAILALGIIKKRPEVITTEKGDEIAIRSMMYLSLSFDHRVVDGFLGGSFLRKVGDYLEQFDTNTTI
ncbi:dihydrolipoamide acetyltransferase family protein [Flavobacterium capsici]|uniref:Dihydrolipoamide acetyltransferase component of pyruvate dehydrogenase complex n=1 Tax=Flavobacterium capsici TaxID=3075618 RepID=A0AA96EW67_9FLAO|nr:MULTISPECIES: dihydrolipoamide acetyltransferase family protein [unclassified Flavobacterium]WNM19087.1 dihydrolipoamide acetyltransferase family protein [Flavobacterium sp. PMR2A8]WNM20476.1 dihydrolipoamide acetyltransferase family protein [Flavobacterium sp. PMTSA4]